MYVGERGMYWFSRTLFLRQLLGFMKPSVVGQTVVIHDLSEGTLRLASNLRNPVRSKHVYLAALPHP